MLLMLMMMTMAQPRSEARTGDDGDGDDDDGNDDDDADDDDAVDDDYGPAKIGGKDWSP